MFSIVVVELLLERLLVGLVLLLRRSDPSGWLLSEDSGCGRSCASRPAPASATRACATCPLCTAIAVPLFCSS